ncbi:flavin reductase, partial [Nocardiopsis rhodophaea]
ARLLVAAEAHHRGEHSGALILDSAIAALECSVSQRVEAGDHIVYLAEVEGLPDVEGARAGTSPLIRYGGRYRGLR